MMGNMNTDAIVKSLRGEDVVTGAWLKIIHRRPYDRDDKTGKLLLRRVDDDEVVDALRPGLLDEVIDGLRMGKLSEETMHNLMTNTGRVQMHLQCYGTSGLATNGFNYVAVTNDGTAPAAGDTTLTSEISANGFARAQGAVTLPVGSGTQTTVDKTFTCITASQATQKAALFNAASVGVMNHEVLYTQRTSQIGDTLQLIYTITLT